MSYLYPKRIDELVDVSDVDTPDKGAENNTGKSCYRLPKRVNELDFPESDSEDDKNDKLNCAILNESFILSPSKKLDTDISTRISTPRENSDENNGKVGNRKEENGFESKTESSPKEAKPDVKENLPRLTAYRPIVLKSRTQLFATKKSSHDPSVPSVFQKSQQKTEPEDARVPLIDVIPEEHQKSQDTSHKPADSETPFKKVEPNLFVTPSLRPQSFCSVTTKKSSNKSLQAAVTCERKDKPKAKILFTTPIARPPPGSLMESTPMEMRKLSTTSNRKLSPIKEPSTEKEHPNKQTLSINEVEYIIDKKIGSGGSSSVFLAHSKQSSEEFAIKLVKLDGDQQVIDGYLNETKLLAKLQGNTNVVRLFDYCHIPEKGILYMVMEKGESDLHKILQGYRAHIPLFTLMTYWHQMLQAVNYIHQNGVIHQDLKPANFLMINGRLKLIDFGIASNIAIDSTSIIKFSQAGTFNYISPEALIDTSNGDSPSTFHQPRIRLSTKSDVWSLGCIFYLLIYKKTPFSHIKSIPQKITALTSPGMKIEYPEMPTFYPPILIDIVRKCLIYKPKERSSVADLLLYPFEMIIPIDK